MKSKLLIVAAVVVLAGGGIYYMTTQDKTANKSSDKKSSQQAAEQPAVERASMSELREMNKKSVCTYRSDSGEQKTTGTVYLAESKMVGEFAVTGGSTPQSGNILMDGEYQYYWEKNSTTGFKIAIASLESLDKSTAAQQAVNAQTEYDFECKDWTVDQSKFNVPTNVEFTDFTATVEQAKQSQQDASTMIMAACASITDPQAKAACEASASGQ